jgi:hypothetical protein
MPCTEELGAREVMASANATDINFFIAALPLGQRRIAAVSLASRLIGENYL